MTRQVIINSDPHPESHNAEKWPLRGVWPAKWICSPDDLKPPFVTAYRKIFTLDSDKTIRIHVTADERYELFLDGDRIGRGSERGDRENWFFETYDLSLSAGQHILVGKTWSLGTAAAYAQITVKSGFLLSTQKEFTELLATGESEWEVKQVDGIEFGPCWPTWGTGENIIINGEKYSWDIEKGEGKNWQIAKILDQARSAIWDNELALDRHLLKPGSLGPMLNQEIESATVRFVGKIDSLEVGELPIKSKDNIASEQKEWNLIGTNNSITIPAHTRRRIIIDLNNYYCAYPEIITSNGKGSKIRLEWAEALFDEPKFDATKGMRSEIENKFFFGTGDSFLPDGGQNRRFETLWWQAGRYLELLIETKADPLTIERFALHETRYPLEMTSTFKSNDEQINRVIPLALRGLQMCCHETYMDCPYYEQLMYVGDTRLEVLTTFVSTIDNRLPKKALELFNASIINSGLTQSRYPSKIRQIIPPFSLWWIGMVYDYAIWRGEPEFIRSMMIGVHSVIDAFENFRNADGLVEKPIGWNFMDWVPTWELGVPPDGDQYISGIINWKYVYTLKLAAKLETWIGEPLLADLYNKRAKKLAQILIEKFWSEDENLLSDTLDKKHFSEHSQVLAILSDELDESLVNKIIASLTTESGIPTSENFGRTTIYFTHYLFEMYQKIKRPDLLADRLKLWFELDKCDFKTTFEQPEPSRSDCHAWGAHPIYHYFASILGIRPAAMGFDEITIEPQLGQLKTVKASMVHPKGTIEVDICQSNDELKGTLTLPAGTSGLLKYNGKTQKLASGQQTITI